MFNIVNDNICHICPGRCISLAPGTEHELGGSVRDGDCTRHRVTTMDEEKNHKKQMPCCIGGGLDGS